MQEIDPILSERINRMANARGWTRQQTIAELIEHGLFVMEAEVRGGFENKEVDVLSAAINALRAIPAGRSF